MLGLLLTSCGQNSTKNTEKDLQADLFEKMRSQDVAEFGAVEYTITKLVQSRDDEKTLWARIKNTFGTRKVLMRCKATMKAGIDLGVGNYRAEVDNEKKSIILSLPHATVFSPIDMDINDVEMLVENKGVLRDDFTLEELVGFLQLGEQQILADETIKKNIIKQAEETAEPMFRALLIQLGFETIKIEFVNLN